MPDLSNLYSNAENAQLQTLQTAYNNAVADLQAETVKNQTAKASHITIPAPNMSVKWANPVVNGGQPMTPSQYQAWLTASDNLITFYTTDAATKKIALDDYVMFLNDKYTISFSNANPELAATIATTTAQIEQANATEATAQAKGLETQAEIDASKRKQNIIIFSVIGGLLLVGIIIYFVKKKN